MNKLFPAVLLTGLLAGSAFAQTVPQNNGVNQLNPRGTLGDAPSIGGPYPPADCGSGDARLSCQQAVAPEERGSVNDPTGQRTNTQTEQNNESARINAPMRGHDGGG